MEVYIKHITAKMIIISFFSINHMFWARKRNALRRRFFYAHKTHVIIGTCTLTPAYLYCEFALYAHFQCVVRTYDSKCVENANQLVAMQSKIINIHMRWEALVR